MVAFLHGVMRLSAVGVVSFMIATGWAESGFETVRSFGFPDKMGESPSGGVIEGSDGKLYGATVSGGANGDFGVVYTAQRDGSGYIVLHHFAGEPSDGAGAVASLAEAEGVLYGTTASGGSANGGTAFKMNRDGTGYTVLHHFGSAANDGSNLHAGILVGSDGMLYGATRAGGQSGAGTVYKMNSDGSNYSVFYNFSGGNDGAQPRGTLIEISNRLYGSTSNAGEAGGGVIYAVNKDGSDFAVLHAFGGGSADGSDTWSGLAAGSDGVLYGTTRAGGSAGQGIVFKLNPNGAGYEILHHFGGAGDGQQPWAGLLEGADGKLYGTARNGGAHNNGTVFRLNKNGSNYESLRHFNGAIEEGYRPEGTLIRSTDGAIYGTTRLGGRNNIGSIYKLQPDGSAFATLHDFSGAGGDGIGTTSRLLAASDGYLYGTTVEGGAFGYGAIFKARPDGTDYQLLHSFQFDTDDGINPYEGLSEDADGTLFGATRFGGGGADLGAIFKLNKNGSSYEVIHRFTGGAGTGSLPAAGVIVGSDGKLYGRTLEGGTDDGATVFRLNRDGTNFEILHRSPLSGGNTFYAYTGVIEASDGRLYANSIGDGNQGGGAVISLNKDGSDFRVLHQFSDTGTDGRWPEGGVIEASDGILYGTTSAGGNFDWGALFRINKDGSDYRILHHFNTVNNGAYYPVGDFLEGPGGTLFGVTYFGGADDSGTIYMVNRGSGAVTVLHSFIDAQRVGVNPNASLIRGRDGGIYGAAVFGGQYDFGTIFRIAPISLSVAKETSGYRTRVTGKIGQRYAIERVDKALSSWMEIGQAENVNGVAEFLDTSGGPDQQYYRSRLILP